MPSLGCLLMVKIQKSYTNTYPGKWSVFPQSYLVALLVFVIISLAIKYICYRTRFEILTIVLLKIPVSLCRMVTTDSPRITAQSTYNHCTVSKPRHLWSTHCACLRVDVLSNQFLCCFLCPTWQVSGKLSDKDDDKDCDTERQYMYVEKLNDEAVWML
jgi:hypothetical protein